MVHPNPYTYIRRGPMGGDHYTQIHNGVFRDRTLTPNAKAIFGLISTHTQGWGTSIEDTAEAIGVSRDTAKRAMQLLKKRHYLVFGQDRGPRGTMGQGWYFLTDLPAQLTAAGVTDDRTIAQAVADAVRSWNLENRRSEPVVQIRPPGALGASPQVVTGDAKTAPPVQPLAVLRSPKKTKELQEDHDQENHQDLPPRSKFTQSAIAPSPHGGDGAEGPSVDQECGGGTTENRLDEEGQQPSTVQAGVHTPTPQDRTTKVAGGGAVENLVDTRPDDLGWWGGDLPGTSQTSAGVALSPAQRERALYAPQDGYLDAVREERWQGAVDELCGGLDPHEEHARDSMLDRGEHYLKVANTILRQRGVGYCCG